MKKTIPIIGLIIIAIILVSSFTLLDKKIQHDSATEEVTTHVTIDDTTLEVKYLSGNMLDERLAYGNKVSKTITINNKSDKDISFAVALTETMISESSLTYSVSYSYQENAFTSIKENINITKDDNLAYNLVIAANSQINLKIDFLANAEQAETIIKGRLSVISNLSDKDIFRKDVLAIHSNVLLKIANLNGINESGLFIFNLNSLTEDVLGDFTGYIMIDATDYSDLKFHYYLDNGKYMLDNYNLLNNDIDKKYIKDIDDSRVEKFSFANICSEFTKKECRDFKEITYTVNGGKENFAKESYEVINLVKDNFKNKDKLVYIYDVKKDINNNTNVRGYILVNNTGNEPEYFLYLTNDIYMISGYNLTKLGNFKEDSATIRAFSDTAFNLAGENASTVCSFSGFSECRLLSGEKV